MRYKVNSEIGPLRFVITHRPGIEHEYVTPKNLVEKIEDNQVFVGSDQEEIHYFYLIQAERIDVSKIEVEY